MDWAALLILTVTAGLGLEAELDGLGLATGAGACSGIGFCSVNALIGLLIQRPS
jgi:hypothetical protein